MNAAADDTYFIHQLFTNNASVAPPSTTLNIDIDLFAFSHIVDKLSLFFEKISSKSVLGAHDNVGVDDKDCALFSPNHRFT